MALELQECGTTPWLRICFEISFLCKILKKRNNVTVITGTGRAGTSFLIGLLSLLHLPTGFDSKRVFTTLLESQPHAGLESEPRMIGRTLQCDHREIYKSPRLLENTYWLRADNIAHVIVPMRKSEDAAASRKYQSEHHNPSRGGFWLGARNETEQMIANDHAVASFLWSVSKLVTPTFTVLQYPKHVQNGEYTYAKMKSFLDAYDVGKQTFVTAHAALSNESLVHTYSG